MRQAEARGESLDEAALSKLAATMCLEYRPGADVSPTDIVLNGVVLPSAALLSEEASQAASRCGAEPAVRAALIPHQRAWGAAGCVCEGRDMGTVIFPTADFKIYLTASLEERAVRRYREHLRRAGEPGTEVSRESAGFKAVLESLRARDERDAQRSAAPLLRANDAQVIDSSGIGPSEVLQRATERIDALARERGLFVDTGALSSPSPREADIGDP
jgi:cytidylate kinase